MVVFGLTATLVLTLLLLPVGAEARPANVVDRQQISTKNPFPDDEGRCKADEDLQRPPEQTQEERELETEPSVAVNPKDPRNIVATWQIGHSPETSVYGVAVSHDGGASWRLVAVPGLSRCNEGEVVVTQDPAVSFAADGTAYLASQAIRPPFAGDRLLVNRSSDGGNTWSKPFAVTPVEGNWDKQRSPVIGDPARSGQAYLLSSHLRDGALTADLFFFKTTDGGLMWSAPQPIFLAPRPDLRPFDSLVEALPDGTLVVTFSLIHVGNYVNPLGAQERHELLAVRSLDGGQSWSEPRKIAETGPLGPQLGAKDPDTGRVVINIPHSQFASAADGTAYVVWHDIESAGSSRVMFALSRDGGETWSEPRTVAAHKRHALLPSVAVMPDGTIGVTWYDTRRDKTGDNELTTDYWFAHSHDGGRRWEEARVAGPFDLNTADRRAPADIAVAFGLGEYTGLSAQPGGFATAFAMTNKPQVGFGAHDVFFGRLELP